LIISTIGTEMRPNSTANVVCILCLIVVFCSQLSFGKVEEEEVGQSLSNLEPDSQDGSDQFEQDAMKRAMMKNMLEQHALRLKRGGFNSGFAHALRVRRGGIGQRSSWGHALRVRSPNMLNRGHALRLKRKPSDYRAFALRVRKNDNSFEDENSNDQEDIENNYLDDLSDNQDYSEPEVRQDVGTWGRQKRMNYGRDLFQEYYGNQFPYSWPFHSRRLRSASFAHALRV